MARSPAASRRTCWAHLGSAALLLCCLNLPPLALGAGLDLQVRARMHASGAGLPMLAGSQLHACMLACMRREGPACLPTSVVAATEERRMHRLEGAGRGGGRARRGQGEEDLTTLRGEAHA